MNDLIEQVLAGGKPAIDKLTQLFSLLVSSGDATLNALLNGKEGKVDKDDFFTFVERVAGVNGYCNELADSLKRIKTSTSSATTATNATPATPQAQKENSAEPSVAGATPQARSTDSDISLKIVQQFTVMYWKNKPIGVVIRGEPLLVMATTDLCYTKRIHDVEKMIKKLPVPLGYQWKVPSDYDFSLVPQGAIQPVLAQVKGDLLVTQNRNFGYLSSTSQSNPPRSWGVRLFLVEK